MAEGDEGSAAAQYVTIEAFNKAMSDQQSRISTAMDNFGDQVSNAILTVKDTKAAPVKEPAKSGDVRQEAIDLIDDPDAYIKKVMESNKDTSELDQIRNDLFLDRVNEMEVEYDAEYGNGAFEEMIKPDLMKAAAELPAKMRASKAHMSMLVRGIKGGLPADKLVEKRSALKQSIKDAEERTRSMEAPGMLRGTGVLKGQGDRLEPEETEYLANLARKGISYSKEQYLEDRKSIGTDIEDYAEEKKKK